MRLALMPALLLALAVQAIISGNSTALAAARPNLASQPPAFFSILAQTATTTTTGTATGTISPTIVVATTTITGTTGAAILTGTVATTVTATTAITNAGSLSPTATLAPFITITPPGQGGGGGNLRLNPFDWEFLTGAPGGMGPFAWLGLLLMLGLLGAGVYFYLFKRPGWKKTNALYHRAAGRWAPVALWLSILGLLLTLFRIIPLDFFNLRFWLYLWLLATVASAAYFVYWLRTIYPKEAARYEKTQRARQYMPGAGRASGRRAAPASSPAATTSTKTATKPTQRAASGSARKRKKR